MRIRSQSEIVRRAAEYIRRRHASIRRIPQVAVDLDINYHTLRVRFRRETRLTLEQFLTRVRVEQALVLLDRDDLYIKEIAWEVGFQHEGQLTRAFQKLLGRTPQSIRAGNRIRGMVEAGLDQMSMIRSIK